MKLSNIKSWAAYGVGFAIVYVVAKALRVPVELHEGHVDIKGKGKGKRQAQAAEDGTKES